MRNDLFDGLEIFVVTVVIVLVFIGYVIGRVF